MTAPPVAELEEAVVLTGGFPVLAGVTLRLEPATLTVIVGANGAGKTSLLRLLGGLDALSRGRGVVAGVDLAHGDRRVLRRRVGWLGHEGSFYDDLSVEENLRFAARALARPLDEVAPALRAEARPSRNLVLGLKDGRAVGNPPLTVAARILLHLKSVRSSADALAGFLRPSATLVPVPWGTLLTKGALWVPEQLTHDSGAGGVDHRAPLRRQDPAGSIAEPPLS